MRPTLLALPAFLALSPLPGLHAQGSAHDHGAGHAHPAAEPDTAVSGGETEEAMSGRRLDAGPHLRLTPLRPPSAADSARGAALLATLRSAIDRYRDVRVAEAEGYEMFAPEIATQRIYHFTHRGRAIREYFRFDPTQPTSLLYTRDASGALVLLGAMYVAPKRASLEDLDARVPLSLARWHAHTDICLPKRRERERWAEREGDRMRFGPSGAIATREACDAAGGRFHEQLFGWMVHVNAYATDPGGVWGDDHGAGHAH